MPNKPRKNASDAKPYPDYPLTPHKSGRWRKIFRGRAYWFGPLDDPYGSLKRFNHAWPYIKEGKRVPPMPGEKPEAEQGDSVNRLEDTLNAFLEHRAGKVRTGELGQRMLADYAGTARLILKAIEGWRDVDDLTADDFDRLRAQLGRGRSLQTLANHVTRTRSMFRWIKERGYAANDIDFGPDFTKPKQDHIDHQKSEQPDKAFEADEIRKLIDAAPVLLKAMILLGINAAYGNTDIALVDRNHVNSKSRLLTVPRSKTSKPRQAILWPETIKAIREAMVFEDKRREQGGPLEEAAVGAMFVTKYGRRWRRFSLSEDMKPRGTDAVGLAFRRLRDDLGMPADGRGFYGLRHSFLRVTDGLADVRAVDLVMGHGTKSIRNHYAPAESIEVERSRAVADHVHNWLFPPKKTKKKPTRRSR